MDLPAFGPGDILKNKETNKPVAKANVKTVFLGKNDKPCDIPQSLLDTFTEA